MIDSYSFGKITVNGQSYTADIIIYPEKINASWWRKEGHSLCVDDIQDILDYQPDTFIVGQGKPGLMTIPPEVQKTIQDRGIELFFAPTKEAVREFNSVSSKKKTVAALHLTC